jgi:retron-type reverse transcriptase
VDWINPTGAKKVHSLIDKVYQRKNPEMAWETVKANRGSGGVDRQTLAGFTAQLDQQLDRLQSEMREDFYRPQPVRQVQIPKAGKPGEFRTLGIPAIRLQCTSGRPWPQHYGADPVEIRRQNPH